MAEPPEQQPTDTTQIPPWMTRYNSPGLSKLVYRGGRYRRALSKMLARLPVQPGEGEGTTAPPLALLNTEVQNDWTLALLRAWAAVTEVLGFYQERIVNEGYLRTATERRSVLELVRMIGYELRPGVAASADLAFTVSTAKEEPARQVVIPIGTAIQSVPAPGELSQTFETSAEFTARSEWNALKPALFQATSWPPYPVQEAASARLIGADTGVRAGETIMIVGDAPEQDGLERPWLLAELKTVKPFPEQGYTLVTWEWPLVREGSSHLRNPQAFVMRHRAKLFGYSPAGVASWRLPPPGSGTAAFWAPTAIGLPQAPVQALIGNAQGVLFAGTGQGLFRSFNHGENWQPVRVGLMQKDTHALTLDQEGRLLAGMDDGHIYLSKDGGDEWAALSGEAVILPPRGLAKLWSRGKTPLSKTPIRSLVAYSRGRRQILAAATDVGVFRSRDRGKTWLPANKDLPGTDAKTGLASDIVRALAASETQKKASLYAGTKDGVFHIRESLNLWLMGIFTLALALLGLWWPSNQQTTIGNWLGRLWPEGLRTTVETLYGKLCPEGLQSIVGRLLGQLCIEGQLKPDDITNLVITKLGMLTLFLLVALIIDLLVIGVRLLQRSISQLAAFRLDKSVHALVTSKQGQLIAGTEQGLYRSNDGTEGGFLQQMGRRLARLLLGDLARRWKQISDLAGQDIRALGVSVQGDLLAGTGAGSVFRSYDDGDTWEPFGSGLPIKPILAIWPTKDRTFVAGPPPESPVESSWSPFQVEHNVIDLDQVYPQVSPGAWVMLSDGEKTKPGLYKVTQVEVVDSQDLARLGRFSRITVDRDDGLDRFDRKSTLVLVQGEPLRLLSDRPVDEDVLTFDHYVPGLEGGQKLIVSGKRMRLQLLSPAAKSLKLISLDGQHSADLEAGELYQVLGMCPGSDPGTKEWRLRTRAGAVRSVTAATEQIKLEPAGDGDEIVSEVIVIAEVGVDPWKRTTVKPKLPLANIYDLPTVTVHGNIVSATHGKTIAGELLGSSEGLSAHQRFLLKQRPLTYISAATGSGVESTVKIEIDGVRWKQATSFDRLDLDRRTFLLRHDVQGDTDEQGNSEDQGNTVVLFGFGPRGTGVPSGIRQIQATYRQGLGREGNLTAGSLHLLQNALPGLKAVTNPLAASGGADPETMAVAREKAPLSARAMERIVSLSDYEDFSRQFAGIGKVQARLISRGPQQWLHITIADTAGNEVAEDSDQYKNLADAIYSSRASHTPPVQIDSFERVFFRLKARVWIEPAYQARMAEIKEMAHAAIADAFAFERREFGQPVAAADIISLIHSLPGVVAVKLEQFYRQGQKAKLYTLLKARVARWEDDGLHAAEMLVIQPVDGIELDLEDAP